MLEAFKKFLGRNILQILSRVNWIIEIKYAIRTPTLTVMPILFFKVKGVVKYSPPSSFIH